MNAPEVGKLAQEGALRDAIHVAVAAVQCGTAWLKPGNKVKLVNGKAVLWHEEQDSVTDAVGIVDPFLPHLIYESQWFWLFIYPNTVTSLRHAWTHPAFNPSVPKPTIS